MLEQLSEYISTNAPMSNIPALLGLHHSNPLGFKPLAFPIFLLVMGVVMSVIIYFIYKKGRRNLYSLIYALWGIALIATYYYCFSGDLPLFTDTDLGCSEICIGWFCQRQIVGIGWSIAGVVLLSCVVYCLFGILLHFVAHQSDRIGLTEKQWREWSWIIAVMLLGACIAGLADDFVPVTGIWIMIVYHVVIFILTLLKLIADIRRTNRLWPCLLTTVVFLVALEGTMMLAIECIEGYVYLFIPIVGLFFSANYNYNKKVIENK